MTMLKTFDLKGNKQSFAEWISNLSPCETPFVSMIGKEGIDQTQYSWQTDRLSAPGKDSAGTALGDIQEGSVAVAQTLASTAVVTNFTKIFRKGVKVTDTAGKVSLYGRGSELGYQMEKAGMELKRDLEHYLLSTADVGTIGSNATASKCSGIHKLIAAKGAVDGDTGAIVHFETAVKHNFTKEEIFKMTYNLYLAGARATKIMVHPQFMHLFSDFIGDASATGGVVKTPHLHRMFDGLDNKYNAYVKTLRDPLGQVFEIIPNRYMPKTAILFFNEADWTQMVLREPTKTELGKTGATTKFLIEMEVGLRHRNPYASGLLLIKQADALPFVEEVAEVKAEEPKVKTSRKSAK